jgi:hypothetical protein
MARLPRRQPAGLDEALQSAKARKFVKSPQETDAFCQGWASNVESALALGEDPRLLVMRYEDLLADKGPSLARVESFAGVRGLRLDAFAVKLNTFVGDEADGHSPTQYIEPAALTPADLDAIERHAGPMIRRLYPEGP